MTRTNRPHAVSRLAALCLAVAFTGCIGAPESELEQASVTTKTKADELRIDINRHAIAYDFAGSNSLVHSAAGDERLVFVVESLPGAVTVLDRVFGHQLSALPAPPVGWLLPFAVRVPREGRVVVLDSGGFPSPTVPTVARIYEYDYTFNRITRRFNATLVRTISFAGLPIVFTEDFDILPNGAYVVSESIIGAIWHVAPNGTITPALFPDSLNPGEGIPALGPCTFTPVDIGGIPFSTAGNFAPGIGAMANRNGQLYFGSTCRGGISRIPIASLTDPTRTPQQRAADIVTVTAKPAGIAQESLHGLAFNRWDANDNRLYTSDSMQRRLIRINTTTGAREVLTSDTKMFDFPVGLQFLPPVEGLTPLVVASDQEYRLAALNPLITTDLLQPPWVIAKVYILP